MSTESVAYVELLTLLCIALATPGPNALTCFAHSGLYGRKSNIKLITGMVIGVAIMGVSVGLLIDTLLENDAAMTALHWVGILFLVAMATAMFRIDPLAIKTGNMGAPLGLKAGSGMQFVNGKEWAFLLIMMSQFIEPLGGGLTGIIVIMSTTLTVCVAAMVLWTFAGSRINNLFTDPVKGRRIFRICGGLLTLLTIAFLIQGPVTAA